MTDVRSDELPADVQALIGELQYEEEGDFPVERGYFWTSAASVENGNPLFWDDAVADEITDGPVAPLIAAVGVVPPPPLGARARRSRSCRCRSTSTSRRASSCPRRS